MGNYIVFNSHLGTTSSWSITKKQGKKNLSSWLFYDKIWTKFKGCESLFRTLYLTTQHILSENGLYYHYSLPTHNFCTTVSHRLLQWLSVLKCYQVSRRKMHSFITAVVGLQQQRFAFISSCSVWCEQPSWQKRHCKAFCKRKNCLHSPRGAWAEMRHWSIIGSAQSWNLKTN